MGLQLRLRNERAKLAIRKDPGTYKIAQARESKTFTRERWGTTGRQIRGVSRKTNRAECIEMTNGNVDDQLDVV